MPKQKNNNNYKNIFILKMKQISRYKMKIFVEKQYLKILHISFETNFLLKKKLLQIFLKNMYFSILFALRYSYLISLCFALIIFLSSTLFT